ncbi:hypothetical protein CEXT_211171 [Caerostris extrusa]|uniref:Uncharacterized protein n=1 Tax=Caerostris extrusa TaxID=172846 RepID=A0AAV4XWG9_CAEEX|nr:hypothetical protein CEXT_211171 [Caerostris extrusa]
MKRRNPSAHTDFWKANRCRPVSEGKHRNLNADRKSTSQNQGKESRSVILNLFLPGKRELTAPRNQFMGSINIAKLERDFIGPILAERL